eukprot:TRINITY_DN9766_c0_g2_i1.p1 TRINITY_DN9766_c0_g2~~TRINITY_DN9766_c0_g2_i1.p1  ORF type:complete len:960 (+),score=270.45 TRINITY_DN9766_c0_g2_i1:69-2882(+)
MPGSRAQSPRAGDSTPPGEAAPLVGRSGASSPAPDSPLQQSMTPRGGSPRAGQGSNSPGGTPTGLPAGPLAPPLQLQRRGSEFDPGADRQSWLEMKTMLGWAPRWCEFCAANCQLIRQHDKEDRSSRKISDLRRAQLRLEDGHSVRRYFEIAFARSPGGEVYTLRMRVRGEGPQSAQEALSWVQAIRRAQRAMQLEETEARAAQRIRHFRIVKQDGGKIGLSLRGATVLEVAPGGPAAAAGLAPGMKIWTVDGKRINKKDAYDSIIAAPQEFQVSVLLPASDPSVAGAALRGNARRAAHLLARVGERRRELRLDTKLLLGVAAFAADTSKLHVVLWGWGQDVESKRMEVPSASSTARDVHQRLDQDSAWLSAREGGCTWDTKAVYFAGPAQGPSAGRQWRVLPGEPLTSQGVALGPKSRGVALHIVSVASRRHLELFSAAAEPRPPHQPAGEDEGGGAGEPGRSGTGVDDARPLDDVARQLRKGGERMLRAASSGAGALRDAVRPEPRARHRDAAPLPPGAAVPYERYRAEIDRRDAEILRLRQEKSELLSLLEHAGLRTPRSLSLSSVVPWDEEEPAVVATLRNRVERAQTLRDLERIDIEDADAGGFFTPVGTPKGSERDCADARGWQEIEREEQTSPEQTTPPAPKPEPRAWTGPPTAPKAGMESKVRSVPRHALETMETSSASDGYAAGWHLRCGPNYSRTGKKIPSLEALYSFHGADVYRSDQPLEHVATRIQLPKVSYDCAGLPPVVVFCLQIPYCESPSMWGQDLGGPTANAVLTFVCKESTAEAMRVHDQGGERCPGAALIREYARHVPIGKRMTLADDTFLGRFKLAVRAAEGVPGAFAGYNGKPVLVTKSGRYFRDEAYLEVDCNLRAWAYPARVALYSMWSKLGQFRCHVGLCVEARDDSEMNERLLGCCQMSEIEWEGAKEWHGT